MNRLFSHSFLHTIKRESVALGHRVLNQVGRAYAHQFSPIPKGIKLGSLSYQFFKQRISQVIIPKISLEDISADSLDKINKPQRNKIKPITDIGSEHLFSSDHQKSTENPNPLKNRDVGNRQREKQISKAAEKLPSSKQDKTTEIDLKRMIGSEYADLSDIPLEEPIGDILGAISTLFYDQEEEESLIKKGREIFKTALAEGKDQLLACAREIEFKAAAILVKMADQGVIFQKPDISAITELESQIAVLKQKISEYSGNAYDEFRQKIVEEKNRIINSYIEKHFSFEIAGHRSLKALFDDIFETRILQVLLGITNMQGEINPHMQEKLSQALQPENMEYMGVALFMGLRKILVALQESEGKSSEKMLEILITGSNQSSKNVETYKKEVEERVVNRLGDLISDQTKGEGSFYIILKQYTGMKIQIRKLMFQTLANLCNENKIQFLKSLKINAASPSKEKGEEIEKPQEILKELMMEKIGLNSILKQFDQHSDLLFYFMLDTMTEALDEVIKHPNPENRAAKLDGLESASSLKEAVKNFTNHTTTLLPASLKMILQPLLLVVEEQGHAKTLLDFTTPVLEQIIPKLQYFLKT